MGRQSRVASGEGREGADGVPWRDGIAMKEWGQHFGPTVSSPKARGTDAALGLRFRTGAGQAALK